VRWEELFDDLESRFEELADAELLAELADRARVAAGAIPLVARMAGAVGARIRLVLTSGGVFEGELRRSGPDWALIAAAPGREMLVNLAAVSYAEGLLVRTGAEPSGIARRLDLRHMLRGVVRDRAPVSLLVPGAPSTESGAIGTELTGTLDRVGADFVELARHAPWEPRRAGAVLRIATIPIRSVVAVRAVPLG
jgi:hypothetical protein